MTKELEKLNSKYNDDTYPIFPFVSKERITPILKGYYRKNKAKFRGVTATYNKQTEEYEFPLYGIYIIEKNIVIVPKDLELTPKMKKFLDLLLSKGFEEVSDIPQFETYKFPADSEEAKIALMNKLNYQTNLHQSDNSSAEDKKDNQPDDIQSLKQYADKLL